ncbi:MAG TPA: pyrroline-5-carboxylate reductase [Opitutaceae bacterium]|jgi:pyrroline-5-carboxylate reductase
MDQLAFLGSGSMAAAMVDGLIAKGAPPSSMSCIGGTGQSAAALAKRTGIRLASSLEDLLRGAGTLVVAFKPQHLSAADPRLAPLTEGKLVLSVLAGKRLEALGRAFPGARNVVRTMPNTPSQIGAGITGWCALRPLSPADRGSLQAVLEALGQQIELPEGQMDAFTAICGCGPAYVFEFAAALRDAALSLGFDAKQSRLLAVETLLGAARLLARKDADPEVLRSEVTSPNGATAAGLRRMADMDFRGMIRAAAAAAAARAQELSA